jgi:hypothetical protein
MATPSPSIPPADGDFTEYEVTWVINMDGRTPREAAEAALAAVSDPHTDALVFQVREPGGQTRVIDLGSDESYDYDEDEVQP